MHPVVYALRNSSPEAIARLEFELATVQSNLRRVRALRAKEKVRQFEGEAQRLQNALQVAREALAARQLRQSARDFLVARERLPARFTMRSDEVLAFSRRAGLNARQALDILNLVLQEPIFEAKIPRGVVVEGPEDEWLPAPPPRRLRAMPPAALPSGNLYGQQPSVVRQALNRGIRRVLPRNWQGRIPESIASSIFGEWAGANLGRYTQIVDGKLVVDPALLVDRGQPFQDTIMPVIKADAEVRALVEAYKFLTDVQGGDEEGSRAQLAEGVVMPIESSIRIEEERSFARKEQLAQGRQEDRLRAAIIDAHMGRRSVPLPRRFRERALIDYSLYHGRSAERQGEPCPTCVQLVRLIRVPGVTPADVSALMEWYVTAETATPQQ